MRQVFVILVTFAVGSMATFQENVERRLSFLEAHTVMQAQEKNGLNLRPAFCDFSNTLKSLRSVLEAAAYPSFEAIRDSSGDYRVAGLIPFDRLGASTSEDWRDTINLRTGAFTAPSDGVYYFYLQGLHTFHENGNPGTGHQRYLLEVNDRQVEEYYSESKALNVAFYFGTHLSLGEGDRVAFRLSKGTFRCHPNRHLLKFGGRIVSANKA